MNVIEMSDIETNPILDSRELSDDSKTVLVMLAKMLSPQPKDRPSMSDIIEDSEFMSILQLPEKMRAVQSNILDLNRSLGGVFGTIPRFELPMRGGPNHLHQRGRPKVFGEEFDLSDIDDRKKCLHEMDPQFVESLTRNVDSSDIDYALRHLELPSRVEEQPQIKLLNELIDKLRDAINNMHVEDE